MTSLSVFCLIIASGFATLFVMGPIFTEPARVSPSRGTASAFSADPSRELVFYGGLTGRTVVARITARPLRIEETADGEYYVRVPGAAEPVYLAEPYAVVYFEPTELSAAHALIMTDSSFTLRAGDKVYKRVLPRVIYREGAWDPIFYRGAVAFRPVRPAADLKITLDVPYSVDPGTPAAVTLAAASVEFDVPAFYPPGVPRAGQVTDVYR